MYRPSMNSDPRSTLAALIAAFERHYEAAAASRGDDDPALDAATEQLATAFDAYDDALVDTHARAATSGPPTALPATPSCSTAAGTAAARPGPAPPPRRGPSPHHHGRLPAAPPRCAGPPAPGRAPPAAPRGGATGPPDPRVV